jgi:hypothetical protein
MPDRATITRMRITSEPISVSPPLHQSGLTRAYFPPRGNAFVACGKCGHTFYDGVDLQLMEPHIVKCQCGADHLFQKVYATVHIGSRIDGANLDLVLREEGPFALHIRADGKVEYHPLSRELLEEKTTGQWVYRDPGFVALSA